MLGGRTAPEKFGESFTALPAKGSLIEDLVQVVRPPEGTRPLNLKNCDNKTCTGVVHEVLAQDLPRTAPKEQRGLVRFRQGLEHIVDMDAQARIQDFLASSNIGQDVDEALLLLALMISFDFATAFPSVSHEYLFICLQCADVPTEVVNYFKALCMTKIGCTSTSRALFGSSASLSLEFYRVVRPLGRFSCMLSLLSCKC